jgi:hypothetical protein
MIRQAAHNSVALVQRQAERDQKDSIDPSLLMQITQQDDLPDIQLCGHLLVGFHVEALYIVRLVDHRDEHRMEGDHDRHGHVDAHGVTLQAYPC